MLHLELRNKTEFSTSFDLVESMRGSVFLWKITVPSHGAVSTYSYEAFIALNSFSASFSTTKRSLQHREICSRFMLGRICPDQQDVIEDDPQWIWVLKNRVIGLLWGRGFPFFFAFISQQNKLRLLKLCQLFMLPHTVVKNTKKLLNLQISTGGLKHM